jgi:hypothetical protein
MEEFSSNSEESSQMNAADIQCATGLVCGFVQGPSSNLGRRFIIVYLAVSLSTSGNKVKLVLRMCRALSRGGGFNSKS